MSALDTGCGKLCCACFLFHFFLGSSVLFGLSTNKHCYYFFFHLAFSLFIYPFHKPFLSSIIPSLPISISFNSLSVLVTCLIPHPSPPSPLPLSFARYPPPSPSCRHYALTSHHSPPPALSSPGDSASSYDFRGSLEEPSDVTATRLARAGDAAATRARLPTKRAFVFGKVSEATKHPFRVIERLTSMLSPPPYFPFSLFSGLTFALQLRR